METRRSISLHWDHFLQSYVLHGIQKSNWIVACTEIPCREGLSFERKRWTIILWTILSDKRSLRGNVKWRFIGYFLTFSSASEVAAVVNDSCPPLAQLGSMHMVDLLPLILHPFWEDKLADTMPQGNAGQVILSDCRVGGRRHDAEERAQV